MSLTAAQKYRVKHHLGLSPQDTQLDNTFTLIALDAVLQTSLESALTACDTAETAIDTAHSQNSDLIEGGGARFDYSGHVSRAKRQYREKVRELSRVLDCDGLTPPALGGNASLTGWLSV